MNDKLAEQLGSARVYPHHLEQGFPHIIEQIAEFWGKPALGRYLDDLLFDHRGNRNGFSPAILLEIFALQTRHRATQPLPPPSIDSWRDNVSLPRHERVRD